MTGIIMNQRPCPRISPNAVIRFRRSGPHMHAFYIGTRCFSPFRHVMLRPHLRSGLECIRSKIGEAPPSVTNLLPASARSHGCIFDRYFDGNARASAKPLIFLVTPTGIEPVFQP